MQANVPLLGAAPYAGHRRTCYTIAAASVAPTSGSVAPHHELQRFVRVALQTGLIECVCSQISTREVDASLIRETDEILWMGSPWFVTHVARMRGLVAISALGPYAAVLTAFRPSLIRRFAQDRG